MIDDIDIEFSAYEKGDIQFSDEVKNSVRARVLADIAEHKNESCDCPPDKEVRVHKITRKLQSQLSLEYQAMVCGSNIIPPNQIEEYQYVGLGAGPSDRVDFDGWVPD